MRSTDVGLAPADVDLLMTVSVTGVAAPSLDARLVPMAGLRPDVKRVPVFGLGCVAGAAGVARLHDYLVGHPDDVAVLLSVELCSLTVQRDDASVANLVASGLFGDGAVAVVAHRCAARRAARAAGPTVVATRSRLYPDSERVMGWDIGDTGFRIVLDASVAEVVRGLPRRRRASCSSPTTASTARTSGVGGTSRRPEGAGGGPGRAVAARPMRWRSPGLAGRGRQPVVLVGAARPRETLALRPTGAGEPAVLLAMGPGFCSELVLLSW